MEGSLKTVSTKPDQSNPSAVATNPAHMPTQQEWPAVLAFLKKELRPNHAWQMDQEYPTALSISNSHNSRIIRDGKEIVSHAVMKALIVKTPTILLKMGCIGSVVTHSEHRQKGYSKQILESCLVELKNQDCDIAILWTDLYDFYRKLNFELAGFENSIVMDSAPKQIDPALVQAQKLTFKKGINVAPEAILRLYQNHSVHTVRSSEDIRKCLQIPQTQFFTAWNSTGELVAYAAVGKGADLTNYIHEWGGSLPQIIALFRWAIETTQTTLTIILPHHSQNLLRSLKKEDGSDYLTNSGFLGMIKLIQPENIFSKIKKHAHSLGYADFVLEKRAQEFIIGFPNDLLSITDEKTLIQVLFGPQLQLPTANPQTQQKLAQILPIPLWVWGWDSI